MKPVAPVMRRFGGVIVCGWDYLLEGKGLVCFDEWVEGMAGWLNSE
jgi:hypothetical protein